MGVPHREILLKILEAGKLARQRAKQNLAKPYAFQPWPDSQSRLLIRVRDGLTDPKDLTETQKCEGCDEYPHISYYPLCGCCAAERDAVWKALKEFKEQV